MREELTARHILHEHIDMLCILCQSLEIYYEGMRNRTQYFILVGNVVHLLWLDELNFFHDFGTGVLVGIFFLDETDCAERTCG